MSENIVEKIKSGGYWRVVIRPTKNFYSKNRFKIEDLSQVLENTQVRLRGWYYPHIEPSGPRLIAEDKVMNEYSLDRHLEHWEFTTSGQFSHIITMREDYSIDAQRAEKIKAAYFFEKERAAQVDKFFEVVLAIYAYTEIFMFASNLSQHEGYSDVDSFEIIIELHGVKNRLLFVWDWGRELFAPYICEMEDDKITFSGEYSKDDLIAKFNELAIEKITKTFYLFGWKNPNVTSIREDQRKFLERRV